MTRWSWLAAVATVSLGLAFHAPMLKSVHAEDDSTPTPVASVPAPEAAACPLLDTFPPISQQAQQPYTALIRAPGADLPPAQAAFVGAWGVHASDGSDLRLIVFRVLAPDSRVALVGSGFQSEAFATPNISDNVLTFKSGFGNVNTFRMLDDLNSIEMIREAPDGGKLIATFTRCSLS
jgi:hypothetical protein